MGKLPFRVSARTARLIGRENVSNAESAIIELVKNCYDADAEECIIYIDKNYQNVPLELSVDEFLEFAEDTRAMQIIKSNYILENSSIFKIKENIDENTMDVLEEIFASKNHIYIFDNGEGMDFEVIKNHWMTIGTNNKESNIFSSKGRIRTGAKGIGRFALDRLGSKCELVTLSKYSGESIRWKVSWDDFENNNAKIDEVTAEIDKIKPDRYINDFFALLKKNDHPDLKEINSIESFKHGTLIKISNLRDFWDERYISKMYSNLEMLIPPKEEKSYDVLLLSSSNLNNYGLVKSSVCDDYDYKIHALIDEDQTINIKLTRNEFDLNIIDMGIFETEPFKDHPYDHKSFKDKEISFKYDLNELIPGYKKDSNKSNLLRDIGPFDFTLYFMKKNIQKTDRSKYFFKEVNASSRDKWLGRFGGIKLYRDNFRIRPYGDAGGTSFDWLLLGDRVAKSPAAASHNTGQWRVRPYQVSGVVNISRLANIYFDDKSNREGLQENSTFEGLKEILIRLIQVFEKDRQYIIRAIDKYNDVKFKDKYDNRKAKKLAQDVIRRKYADNDQENDNKNTRGGKTSQEKIELLAQSVLSLEKENEDLVTEMQLLRSLASTGLVITSFAHELKNLTANILPRTEDLKTILRELIKEEQLLSVEEFNDPFVMIRDFREQDIRLKNWLDLSLSAIRKDKRFLKKLDLFSMFDEFKRTWSSALNFQSVTLNIPLLTKERCMIRLFQIDFDSIFNNLIANSLDAFQRNDASSERQIYIEILEENKKLCIKYRDSGPGLSKDIKDPYVIFDSLFTTKVDSTGKQIGTGLGMWILKSTVEYYKGSVDFEDTSCGFGLKIILPLRKDEGFGK
ncbi:sensor histidine kinase [Bacillus inaquosorum]|uniref:sensor histidine kinase n=1 Tax=Bacillus inaquosorum TaxID=483913 RepID=UPI002282DFFA|nr:sensor histidine kinase [Bacillus inaquosorum]MCY8147024.1 ATP-binding protein [Bacillus inaquosorum]